MKQMFFFQFSSFYKYSTLKLRWFAIKFWSTLEHVAIGDWWIKIFKGDWFSSNLFGCL